MLPLKRKSSKHESICRVEVLHYAAKFADAFSEAGEMRGMAGCFRLAPWLWAGANHSGPVGGQARWDARRFVSSSRIAIWTQKAADSGDYPWRLPAAGPSRTEDRHFEIARVTAGSGHSAGRFVMGCSRNDFDNHVIGTLGALHSFSKSVAKPCQASWMPPLQYCSFKQPWLRMNALIAPAAPGNKGPN